jgi:hypothetical protein
MKQILTTQPPGLKAGICPIFYGFCHCNGGGVAGNGEIL